MKNRYKILIVVFVVVLGCAISLSLFNSVFINYHIKSNFEKSRQNYGLQKLDNFEFQPIIEKIDSSKRVYTFKIDSNTNKSSKVAFLEKKVVVQYNFFFWKGKVLTEQDLYVNRTGKEAQYLTKIHYWDNNKSAGLFDFYDTIYFKKDENIDTILIDNFIWLDSDQTDSLLNQWKEKTPHNKPQ